MRLSHLFVLIAFLAPVAASQIVGVRLADAKLERKYKKYLSKINGRYYVVGERKSGFQFDRNSIRITAKEEIEIYVADQRHPEHVPYRFDGDGHRVSLGRAGVLSIKRGHLPHDNAIKILMRNQSIAGLASEYELRTEAIDRIQERRDALKKGSGDWFKAQRELINSMERLRTWLDATTFVRAARSYDKKVEKELKRLKEDAVRERYAAAKEKIRRIEMPAEVAAAAKKFGCGDNLVAYEGQHLRVLCCGNFIQDETVRRLVELGEFIVEGFRREIIDPWIEDQDGFVDNTPDDVFALFLFVPDDVVTFEKFYEEIGGNWGPRKAEHLKSSGLQTRGFRTTYFHYWKAGEKTDFEGCIAHGLGHDACNIHFNLGGAGSPQAWLSEAVGYYASFEYLGRNTVTCKGFKVSTYDKPKGKEGIKTVQQGQRAAFNALAVAKGIAVSEMMTRVLFDLDDADLAKSWSFLDYVLHEEGREGIEFLRACCRYGRDRNTVVNEVRAAARPIFNLPDSTDPLQWIDDRWRAFASNGQNKGDAHRERR